MPQKNNLDIELNTRWSIAELVVKGNGETDNYDGKFEGESEIRLDLTKYDPLKKKRIIPDNYINQMFEYGFEMGAFNGISDDGILLKILKTRFTINEIYNIICFLISDKDIVKDSDHRYLVEHTLEQWKLKNKNK